MTFDSGEFLLFFPIAATLYFILPQKWRCLFLLIASYYFYMSWNPYYIVLIVASTLVDYSAGIGIAYTDSQRKKRRYLILSLVANLGLLFTFKYFNFFSTAAEDLAHLLGLSYTAPLLKVLLPVGISFYTFQTLSYTIEVYRGNQDPECNLIRFATYVAFFPQLVAGPIERPQNLLPQFQEHHMFEYKRIRRGLALILWGLFKKVVVSDRLAEVVDWVYATPEKFSGPAFSIATLFFAFQIFCDFSGYSDIAIGTARVMGFRLMRNFDRPYLAHNISDFWRRWHISLSSWFSDYVYIPLGGNRHGAKRMFFAIIAVFLLSGLWHGANWTFIVWGALHAVYYLTWRITRATRQNLSELLRLNSWPRLSALVSIVTVFTLVCFSWIFFRANSLGDAIYITSHLTTGWRLLAQTHFLPSLCHQLQISTEAFLLALTLIGIVSAFSLRGACEDVIDQILAHPVWFRWSFYILMVLAIMNLATLDQKPFIYFQF